MTSKYLSDRRDRTPSVLLSYQKRWVEDNSRVKIIAKSRRIGLSWTEAAEDALLAAQADGSNVYYIGYNKEMAREFIDDVAAWSKHYNLAASEIEDTVFLDDNETKSITVYRVWFDSGFKVEALSSRPTGLRSKQGKVVIDEAAFHENLPGLIKAALALLMWGSTVVIISTHNGDGNYFNELINQTLAKKNTWSYHRVDLDDAIRDGLFERIALRNGQWKEDGYEPSAVGWRQWIVDTYGDDAGEELFCIPSQGSSKYFPIATIKACMRKDIPIITFGRTDEYTFKTDSYRRTNQMLNFFYRW